MDDNQEPALPPFAECDQRGTILRQRLAAYASGRPAFREPYRIVDS